MGQYCIKPEYISLTVPNSGTTGALTSSERTTWMNLCRIVQSAMMSPCESYFNSFGLTAEGRKASECIRNGLIIGGFGLYFGVPPSIGIDVLKFLANITD